MPIDALSVLCAQLTRDVLAIAKFLLLEGLEYYKDTQMKAYNITKLTVELKSSDHVQYRNKIYYSVGCFSGHGYRKHVHTVKVI